MLLCRAVSLNWGVLCACAGPEAKGYSGPLPDLDCSLSGSLSVVNHCIEHLYANGLNVQDIFVTWGERGDDVKKELKKKGNTPT